MPFLLSEKLSELTTLLKEQRKDQLFNLWLGHLFRSTFGDLYEGKGDRSGSGSWYYFMVKTSLKFSIYKGDLQIFDELIG